MRKYNYLVLCLIIIGFISFVLIRPSTVPIVNPFEPQEYTNLSAAEIMEHLLEAHVLASEQVTISSDLTPFSAELQKQIKSFCLATSEKEQIILLQVTNSEAIPLADQELSHLFFYSQLEEDSYSTTLGPYAYFIKVNSSTKLTHINQLIRELIVADPDWLKAFN